MNKLLKPARLHFQSCVAALLAAGGLLLTANASLAQQQPLNNPIVRNPQLRSNIPDTAPVVQDPRNSDTRPTLPAAPLEPSGPRVTIPEPDPSRIGGRATPLADTATFAPMQPRP